MFVCFLCRPAPLKECDLQECVTYMFFSQLGCFSKHGASAHRSLVAAMMLGLVLPWFLFALCAKVVQHMVQTMLCVKHIGKAMG